ncbi:hypothetical protein PtrM4_037840 [Pyrenophora tritici-repentis]|uniref:Uncharacterized protein n=1 Tax=Pyrenophora tritici-repentis TaxID=45151 RepID=A0A834SBS9_9PLEO|nr:hypothetical protein PtrM4_037840 [Pyrenophora tritici-repentis]
MAESHLSQNKLLQLLDVFRDFTELGRVTQQMTEKFTAQLAYQTATLTSASQQATKTLKKANNGNTWTTVSTKKKTNKKPASYYQAVLTLTQPTSHTPLQIRDLINEEFTKGGIKDPVVKEVTTSRKNNIILTTTPTYSGEYLVQHKHIWHQKFELKNVQLLESWTKVVVHNVPTEWEGAETLEILHTEIPAYNNGLQITGNPYWISREWQNKKNSSIVIAFKTAEDAARLGGRITILGQTLFTEKFKPIAASTQCLNCQQFGHPATRCRNQPACNLCGEEHATTTHKCSVCNTKGKPCNHTLPHCSNCKEPHFANSKECELYQAVTKSIPAGF